MHGRGKGQVCEVVKHIGQALVVGCEPDEGAVAAWSRNFSSFPIEPSAYEMRLCYHHTLGSEDAHLHRSRQHGISCRIRARERLTTNKKPIAYHARRLCSEAQKRRCRGFLCGEYKAQSGGRKKEKKKGKQAKNIQHLDFPAGPPR